MRVAEIMSTGLITVAPDTPFKDVVERLVRSGVSSLLVVDGEGKLIGLISEADLMSKEAYGGGRPPRSPSWPTSSPAGTTVGRPRRPGRLLLPS